MATSCAFSSPLTVIIVGLASGPLFGCGAQDSSERSDAGTSASDAQIDSCHVDCRFIRDCIGAEVRDYPGYFYTCADGRGCEVRPDDYTISAVCTDSCRTVSGCLWSATPAKCCTPGVQPSARIEGTWTGQFAPVGAQTTAMVSITAELAADGFAVLTTSSADWFCGVVEGTWGAADEKFVVDGVCQNNDPDARFIRLWLEAPFDTASLIGQYESSTGIEGTWQLTKAP